MFFLPLRPGPLPHRCLLCAATTVNTHRLCDACFHDLPWNQHACHRCGVPLPADSSACCGHCQQSPPVFETTLAALLYERPVDYLVKQLKFHSGLAYAHCLGSLLASTIASHAVDLPDLLIPVPLHKQRLRQRGFNQALEIARPVSRQLGIPIDTQSCTRLRHTHAQSELPLAERAANTLHAFKVTRPAKTRHVALLDDVMTSGQTLSSLAGVLKQEGVERISAWCCARTVLRTA